jgi:glycosyltransferase involved in cell wall biosynthesis
MKITNTRTQSNYKQLVLSDGGSLSALKEKGNLLHVTLLYNPGNYFSEIHLVTTKQAELAIDPGNPTIIINYIRLIPWKIPGICIFNQILFIIALIRIIRRHDIDLIRSRMPFLGALRCVVAGKITGTPVIVSLGGDHRLTHQLTNHYPLLNNRWISERVEEFVLRHADLVFCINEFTRRYAISLGACQEKTRYVPHRIDIHGFSKLHDRKAGRKIVGAKEEPLVIFVGRLTRYKGVDFLIEAVPKILQVHPGTTFAFIGDGILRSELEERARVLGVSASVCFTGFLSNQIINDVLAAADVCWIPMSGFVVYEAAASGVPMIACDVEWHPEFIINNQTGLLVPDRNPEAMSEAVCRLLQDRELAQRLALAAKAKLFADFEPEMLIQREIEIYRQLLIPQERVHER